MYVWHYSRFELILNSQVLGDYVEHHAKRVLGRGLLGLRCVLVKGGVASNVGCFCKTWSIGPMFFA